LPRNEVNLPDASDHRRFACCAIYPISPAVAHHHERRPEHRVGVLGEEPADCFMTASDAPRLRENRVEKLADPNF
jgi:hypothetical protein